MQRIKLKLVNFQKLLASFAVNIILFEMFGNRVKSYFLLSGLTI